MQAFEIAPNNNPLQESNDQKVLASEDFFNKEDVTLLSKNSPLGFTNFAKSLWKDASARSKLYFKFLGAVGVALLVFFVIKSVIPDPHLLPVQTFYLEDSLPSQNSAVFADGSSYGNVWDALRTKAYKFIVFKRDWNNPANPRRLVLEGGPWEFTFDQFLKSIEPEANQVAYIYVGPTSQASLVMVVYNPVSLGKTSDQVLDDYQLPTNPAQLQTYGLNVAKTVIVSKRIDITEAKLAVTTPPASTSSSSSSAATASQPDGSTYASLWQQLLAKNYRFIVFSRDVNDQTKISVQPGAWSAIFYDFTNAFKANQEQVGFYLMSSSSGDQLYEVVYAPTKLTAAQVLTNFGLPTNPAILQQKFGLPLAYTYVATDKSKIDTTSVILNSKSGGIVSLISDDSAVASIVNSAAIFADGSYYSSVWQALRDRTYKFVIFKRDWNNPANPRKLRLEGGTWDFTFAQFVNAVEPEANQVAFVYVGPTDQESLVGVVYNPVSLGKTVDQVLDDYQLPINLAELEAYGLNIAKIVNVRKKIDITEANLAVSGDAASASSYHLADGSAYASIWQQLNNKGYRYVVFSRDVNDPSRVSVQPGSINSLFYDFTNGFKSDQEQVGFYVMSSKNGDQLYEIVFAPAGGNLTPSQILTNFGLPSNPAVLQQKFALPLAYTYVVTDKSKIDLTNVILNSRSGGVVSP